MPYLDYGNKEKNKWMVNQVMLRYDDINLIDAIWTFGSFGKDMQVETYGVYGSDDGEPMIMNIQQAFELFKKAWEENKNGRAKRS